MGPALNVGAVAVLPNRLRLYEGYNNVDGALEKAITDQEVSRALILFASPRWYDRGRSPRRARPGAEGDLIFACSSGPDPSLPDRYPDRPVYLWDKKKLSLYRQALE